MHIEDREWLMLKSSNIYYIVHEMHVESISLNPFMNDDPMVVT